MTPHGQQWTLVYVTMRVLWTSSFLLLHLGGALLPCQGVPLGQPSTPTTRVTMPGRSIPSTEKVTIEMNAPSSTVVPRKTIQSGSDSTGKKYSLHKCDIRSNAADSLAKVPATIGVDQEILSCVTCMAYNKIEVHGLLVDEPVAVKSLHSPQADRHDDIDVYLDSAISTSPLTLVLGSRSNVSWHLVADVTVTPLHRVYLISPKGTKKDFDIRWPDITSPASQSTDKLSVKRRDADVGHLRSQADLEKMFQATEPLGFVTSLTTIHRTHTWRLQVGVESRCSGYKKPYRDKWCSDQEAAIIAVATFAVIGLSIVMVVCLVYRCRKDRTFKQTTSDKQTEKQAERYLRSISAEESDHETKDDKTENGTVASRKSSFYFNPIQNGQSEKLAQQEVLNTQMLTGVDPSGL